MLFAESRSAIKDTGNSNTGSLAFLNVSVSDSLNPDPDSGFLQNPDLPILHYISDYFFFDLHEKLPNSTKASRSPERTFNIKTRFFFFWGPLCSWIQVACIHLYPDPKKTSSKIYANFLLIVRSNKIIKTVSLKLTLNRTSCRKY
jgi:hypothetical protein